MRARFFGTRGSIATAGPDTVRYGGNTSCVELRSNAGTLIVLDMGTGAAVLGRALMAAGEAKRGHVLISHTHWDHIQGLPFFGPLFVPGNEWDIYAPRGLAQSLRETLAGQMQHEYFPVQIEELGATIRYHDLVEGRFEVGEIVITTHYLNHPALTLGYRLEADGITVVYACDHEPYDRHLATAPETAVAGIARTEDRRHLEFLAGADLVIHDAQFLAAEYEKFVGWGHSTVEYAVAMARAAGVKRLVLTHHNPTRNDAALDVVRAQLDSARQPGDPDVIIASEGLTLTLERAAGAAPVARDTAFPAEAAVESALAAGSVMLVFADAARRARLATILQGDHIAVVPASLDDAVESAVREQPGAVVIEDTGDDRAVALAAAIRRGVRDGASLPIALVTPHDDRALGEGAFSERLVEPYSDSYARTRLRALQMRAACRWLRAPKPSDEERRLAATRALGLLDTPEEERFDRITRLAAALFDVPVALITLIDRDRQFFKSHCGIDLRETARDESFCAHAVYQRTPLIVPDALLDDRFADHPAVTGPPHVRFYAGHPLVLADNSCIGTLCLVGVQPRHFDDTDQARLADLAALVLRELTQPAPA